MQRHERPGEGQAGLVARPDVVGGEPVTRLGQQDVQQGDAPDVPVALATLVDPAAAPTAAPAAGICQPALVRQVRPGVSSAALTAAGSGSSAILTESR